MKDLQKIYGLILLVLVALYSCTNEEALNIKSTGTLSFSFVDQTNDDARVEADGTPSLMLISVKDEDDNYVLNMDTLPIYKIGDGYITENVTFDEGDYTIEDFLVLDENDSVIYLTPKSGSDYADLVSTLLPYPFTIESDNVTDVVLDVISASTGDASDYGYATFSFNVLNVLVLQPDSVSGKDAVIGLFSTLQMGNAEDIRAYAWTQSGSLNVLRSPIEFNLSDLPDSVTIDSAFVSFYFNSTSVWLSDLNDYGHYGNVDFKLQKITEAWDEMSVMWDDQPATSSEDEVLVSDTGGSSDNYEHIDVTNLISDQYQNPSSNYGMMLSFQSETAYKHLIFASSDHPDESLRPKLVVYYH